MNSDKSPYEILYEDDRVIAVYKKRDVLTLRTNDPKTFGRNLYHYLHVYLAKKNEKLYIVHRLDYQTSGVLIFAKSGKMKQTLQDAFKHHEVERDYEAVIREKIPLNEPFHVEMKLSSDGKGGKVYEDSEGKTAVTDFTSVNYIQIGTALKIRISTGRRAQIRLALAHEGFHLLGDVAYSNCPAKRMYLNAYRLKFLDDIGLLKTEFSVKPLWIQEE